MDERQAIKKLNGNRSKVGGSCLNFCPGIRAMGSLWNENIFGTLWGLSVMGVLMGVAASGWTCRSFRSAHSSVRHGAAASVADPGEDRSGFDDPKMVGKDEAVEFARDPVSSEGGTRMASTSSGISNRRTPRVGFESGRSCPRATPPFPSLPFRRSGHPPSRPAVCATHRG